MLVGSSRVPRADRPLIERSMKKRVLSSRPDGIDPLVAKASGTPPSGYANVGPLIANGASYTRLFHVQSTIKNEAQYQKYVQAVVPFTASFGGKLVARRAKVEVLEGEHDERPVVMFEFPDMEAIHAFWNSPDYVPIKKLREGIATMNIWAFPDA